MRNRGHRRTVIVTASNHAQIVDTRPNAEPTCPTTLPGSAKIPIATVTVQHHPMPTRTEKYCGIPTHSL